MPEYNIAIEYNGLYWHSDKFIENNYHLQKTEKCAEKEIQLIHIFDDEYRNKKEIVESHLKQILQQHTKSIDSSQCEIKVLTKKQTVDFLNQNSLVHTAGTTRLGLFFKEELVQVLTAKDNKIINHCSKIDNCIKGEHLLDYFSKDKETVSIELDRRWSDGKYYLNTGFKPLKTTLPDFCYVYSDTRYLKTNRIIDKEKHRKIYDCGKLIFFKK